MRPTSAESATALIAPPSDLPDVAARPGEGDSEIPSTYVEPISPATVRMFPHLADLQGHVVLGGRTTQVVLSGIPVNGSADPWQTAIVAAFVRRDGAWRSLEALGALDWRSAGNGALYVPTGINLGLDAERGMALASVVYDVRGGSPGGGSSGGRSPGGRGKIVTFRLDTVRDALEVELDETSAAWSLRWRALAASDIVGPGSEASRLRGHRYLVRYRQAEVAAFIGYRRFSVTESAAGTVLEPLRDAGEAARPSREGFEILLGRRGAARLHARLAALDACLQPPRVGGKVPAAKTCEKAPPESLATLVLTLPADDGGGLDVPHPVHLFDQAGRLVTYTALYAGDSLELELPANQVVLLADTRQGRAVGTGQPVLLAPGGRSEVMLTRRLAGRLALTLEASEAAPAIVALHRLDAPRGDAYDLGAKTPPGVLRLGPTVFWVSVPHLELPVLAGSYQVDGRRGDAEGACAARVEVPAGGSGAASCALTGRAAVKGAGGIRIDLAGGGWQVTSQALRHALGLDWAASRPGDGAVEGALPSLAVRDPGTGLMLQYVPATASLVAAWSRESRGGRQAEPLARFAAFVRRGSGSSGGLLELGCPTPGVDLAEYETLAQRLGVDAVRLFGCREGLATGELMALYARLHARRQGNLLVTSVSALDLAAVGPYFPQLVLERGAVPAATVEGILAGLKTRRYSLSAGAFVRIASLSATAAKGGLRSLELVVDWEVERGIRARDLVVYTETGQAHVEPLGDGAAQNVVGQRVKLEIPVKSRWVRAEVRGASRRSVASQLFDRRGGLLLSTSTFQSLPK